MTHVRIAGGLLAALLASTAPFANAVSLTGAGYTENFDSMGTSGTAPPAGWSVFTGNSGTLNSTWTTSIPANGANSVASMIPAPTPLTATSAPTATNNNGYNAARLPSATSDRVLATSPTTVSGTALQLLLTNNTGASLAGLSLSFDTVRFTAASSANQLPGYWLFYSLDNTSWTNVAALNPTIGTVPNTVGITNTGGSFNFSAPVANGADVRLRWVDDNATQTSPDQIIGLNNVSISAVPEPDMLAMMLGGLALITFIGRRKRLV
jgi:hypothetical protein